MFSRTLAVASFVVVSMTGAAIAQTIILQPEEEVIVRDYIVTQPRQQIVIPDGYEVVVGEQLPETVVVSPLDAPGLARAYEYVVVDGQTLIVEPGTRRVVQVLN